MWTLLVLPAFAGELPTGEPPTVAPAPASVTTPPPADQPGEVAAVPAPLPWVSPLEPGASAPSPSPAADAAAPPPSAPSAPPPALADCDDDRALLAALLALHGLAPAEGVEALVATGDPRVIPVLADVVRVRRGGAVVDAAVAGLGRFPGATGLLADFADDDALQDPVRQGAVAALGAMGSKEAGDALVALTANKAVTGTLREAVLAELRARYPGRLAEVSTVADAGGTAWVMTGSSLALGYGMATAGHFGQTNLAALGGAAGVAGGATAGWFYTRAHPVSAGDGAFYTVSGVAGTTGAMLLTSGVARQMGVDDREDAVWLAGLGGGGAGYGLGAALAKRHPGTGMDGAEAAVLTAAGTATSAALASFAFQNRQVDGGGAIVAGLATLGGAAAFQGAAPAVTPRGTDLGYVALATAWGAEMGGFVPLAFDVRREGLPVATAGIAGIGAWALSPLVDTGPDQLLGAWVGTASGTAVGTGLYFVIDPTGQKPGALAMPAATLGGAAGLLLAAKAPGGVVGSDVVWGSVATAWTAWQVAGWQVVADSDHTLGWNLLAPGLVSAGSAVGARWLDIPTGSSLAVGSAGLWGSYVGGVAAELATENDGRAVWRWALVGGDVGFVGGGALLASNLHVPPAAVGIADAGGLVVGGAATLVTGLVTDDEDALLAASLGGAGVGLVAGGIVGWRLGRSLEGTTLLLPGLPRARLPGHWSVQPTALPGEEGVRYGVEVVGLGW